MVAVAASCRVGRTEGSSKKVSSRKTPRAAKPCRRSRWWPIDWSTRPPTRWPRATGSGSPCRRPPRAAEGPVPGKRRWMSTRAACPCLRFRQIKFSTGAFCCGVRGEVTPVGYRWCRRSQSWRGWCFPRRCPCTGTSFPTSVMNF